MTSSGVRLVRRLATWLAFAYPPKVRRTYGGAFADVAEHRWRREAARRSPAGATAATIGLLFGDAFAAAPMCWMSTVINDADGPGWPRRISQAWRGGGRDLRLSGRSLAAKPGVPLLVILTLAIGIGASTPAFDALDRTILRPLPFPNGDRMAFIALEDVKLGWQFTPPAEAIDRWRAGAKTIERIEFFRPSTAVRTDHGPAETLDMAALSPGLIGMLHIRPVAGRLLTPADATSGSATVVMLNEAYWRSDFGGSPDVIGRTLTLGDTPVTIVGIWPAGARLHQRSAPPRLFRLLPPTGEPRPSTLSHVLALIRPGTSLADVEAELAALMPPNDDFSNTRPVIRSGAASLGEAYVSAIWLVFAGAVALLAVAIANASHLLIARAATRAQELGIRLALGGSTWRLARLFLAEGLLIGLTAGAAGWLLAMGLEAVVVGLEPRLLATVDGAGLFGRALGFALAVSLGAALLCSVAPLWRARRASVRDILASSGTGRETGVRSATVGTLVGAQAALAVVLVCGAALMTRSVVELGRVDTGVAIDELAEFSVRPPTARYPTTKHQAALIDRIEAAVRATPGVSKLTTSTVPLLNTSIVGGRPWLEGEPEPPKTGDEYTSSASATPEFFDVLGQRLLAGRAFQAGERGVVIVNAGFAQSRGGDVIGKRLFLPGAKKSLEIVGVVADTRPMGVTDKDVRPHVYTPGSRSEPSYARFFVRTAGDPAALLRDVRQRLADIDPTVPMLGAQTGPQVIARQTAQHRFVATVLAGLAAAGFLLAMSGVYGAAALNVSRRTREMGVRLALGATPRRLVRGMVTAGLRPIAAGAALGAIAAMAAARLIESLLFGVAATDPWSLGAGVVIVALAAAAAGWTPARRAARIDPVATLRSM